MDEEEWAEFYMGDDGIGGALTSASLFIDMVERKYAINSCSMERYDLRDTVEEMFDHLKNAQLRKFKECGDCIYFQDKQQELETRYNSPYDIGFELNKFINECNHCKEITEC